MELKQLRSFAAVVKYESFTKAAQKLYLSQPTVSAHVRALEEELGKRLILRSTKNVEITATGRRVYDYVVNMLDLQERITACCRDRERNIIYLGASTIPASYILPEILPEFGRLHPDTYFVIHQGNSQDVIDGVQGGLFDIGLVGMKQESADIDCSPFYRDRIVLITPVTQHFLDLQQMPCTPVGELLAQPMILREKGSAGNKSATDYLESMGVSEDDLHVVARINDQEGIKNLVAGGVGVSLISERAARSFVKERRLLMFELPSSESRTFYIVSRRSGAPERRAQELELYIQAYFRESSPGI